MTAKDWKDSLYFSTQEVRRESLVKRFDAVFQFHIFHLIFQKIELMVRLFHERLRTFHSIQGGGPTGMADVVAHFKKLNGAKGWGEWEVDQVITILFAYS